MRFQWKEFGGSPRVLHRERMYVTLRPRGEIFLNGKAYERLGSPEAAVLLYDENTRTIGVRPADPELPNAFRFVRKGNEGRRKIYACSFCRHFKLKPEKTLAFHKVKIDDGVLLLDLESAVEVSRGEWQ